MPSRRPEYIEVELKAEWMGHPEGSVLNLNEVTASQLVSRGSAVEKGQEAEYTEVEEEQEIEQTKEVKKPRRDKMVSRPARSKSLT